MKTPKQFLLLSVLAICLAGSGPARAQTNCSACWKAVTNWQGTWNLTVVGNIQDPGGYSGTVNNSSQGSFWITNGVHTVHGSGSLNTSATMSDCCSSSDGGGCEPFTDTCTAIASGSLEANGHFGVRIDAANCRYTLLIDDAIGTIIVNNTTCIGPMQSPALGIASCDLAQPIGIGLGVLPYFSLPSFGEHLTGSGAFPATKAATGCDPFGQFTLTLTWDIEAVTDPTPPKFTQLPPGGPLGCNPTNPPNDATILGMADATAASGMVSITASHMDTTNGCTITRTFTLTALDDCLQTVGHAAVVHTWMADKTPPAITSVPAGANLALNPTNPPTDATVKAQVVAIDNCGVPTINVSHADTTSGATMTRTFTVTATDTCGNVSPARTVVYTWTTGTSQPLLTTSRAGRSLVVSWPASATNFVLQSTTNLVATNSWQTLAIVPTASASWLYITNNMTDPVRFFRLRSQ